MAVSGSGPIFPARMLTTMDPLQEARRERASLQALTDEVLMTVHTPHRKADL